MAATERGRSGRPVSAARTKKVLERLQGKIEDGCFYEAHQTYKALYQRLCAQGSEEQATSLLLEGAATLLKHSQWESGTDLGLMLVNHLKSKNSPITEDTLDMISQLFLLYKPPVLNLDPHSAFPAEIDPREVFMRAALKWSSMVGGEGCKYGHPHLHKLLAISYWEVKQYGRAREHFQYACLPEDYAAMLVEVATMWGRPNEADLFLTQAVLQLLVLRNRQTALGVYSAYTHTHPAFRSMPGPPFKNVALLNFTWFLMLAMESGDCEVFKFLRSQYRKALSRDPSFEEYLDKIGASFFGLQKGSGGSSGAAAPTPDGGGGFGGLLGLLGGGGGGSSGGEGGNNLLSSLMSGLSGLVSQPAATPGPQLSSNQPAPPPPSSGASAMLQSVDDLD